MLKQMLAITVAVAAISLATPGTGGAGATCNPHCSPYPSSNSGGDLRGLNRANAVSPVNGAEGRAMAQSKQGTGETDSGETDSGGTDSGGTDTGGTDTGGTDTGGGTTSGPCTGC